MSERDLVCAACGLVFHATVDERTVAADYESLSASGHSAAVERRRASLFGAILARHPAPPGGRCLDVGCGTGAFAREAAARGWQCTGVDPVVTEITGPGFRLVRAGCGGLARAVGADAPFHLVTFLNSLNYVAEPLAAVREAYDLLADGGRVVIRVPNVAFQLWLRRAHRALRRLGIVIGALQESATLPERSFTAASLEILLRRAGFDDVRVEASPMTEGDPYGLGRVVPWAKALLRFAGLGWAPSLLAGGVRRAGRGADR